MRNKQYTAEVFVRMINKKVLMTLLLFLSVFECYGFTLVIDPGHGGKDFGAVGKRTNEKTVNLNVAKYLGELMKENHPDVSTVFTRDKDVFVSLQDRARIANKAGGDLFVSIHVNSVDRKNRNRANIQGASVYSLGLHKSADNLEVAKRENSVMALESDYQERYEGFQPDRAESYIIFELSQNLHFEQSVRLADEIQHELINTAGRADKGVRQAGFWVLWATSMPSVLVELDFICNPTQEKYLASESGQKEMAKAIFNAVSRFVTSGGALTAGRSRETEVTESGISELEGKHKGMYTVVFLTSSSSLKGSDSSLKGMKDVFHSIVGTLHRYSSVPVKDKAQAAAMLPDIQKIFPSAFIKKIE